MESTMIEDYYKRMDWIMDKLDDRATDDKIKLDILQFLETGVNMPCKKCNAWCETLIKLSEDML